MSDGLLSFPLKHSWSSSTSSPGGLSSQGLVPALRVSQRKHAQRGAHCSVIAHLPSAVEHEKPIFHMAVMCDV